MTACTGRGGGASRLRGLNRFMRWISKKRGRVRAAFQLDDRGVEALQVADLQDAAAALGGLDQAVGGGEVGRDGLLHQDVDAGVEQRAADFRVDGGGRGDDGGVDLAGEVAEVGERAASVVRGGLGGAGRIGIDDGGELRARRIRGPRGSGSVRTLRRRRRLVRIVRHGYRMSPRSCDLRAVDSAACEHLVFVQHQGAARPPRPATVVPVSCITGMVPARPPAHRTAVLAAARDLDQRQRRPFTRPAARRSMASVPSMASTATQARSQMATLCPTSKPASALATRRP